jgi:hypothetical protein
LLTHGTSVRRPTADGRSGRFPQDSRQGTRKVVAPGVVGAIPYDYRGRQTMGIVEQSRISILSRLGNIERNALAQRPELRSSFFTATRKRRAEIMAAILDADTLLAYRTLSDHLENMRGRERLH